MRLVFFLMIAVLASVASAGPAVAQSAVSADGVVESSAGGFKFPDGTLQATASPQPGYNNRIADFSPPLPYTEVCFPGDGAAFTFDIDDVGGGSTQGGNCEPGDVGWVIELAERAAGALTTWADAVEDCLEDSMRLPEPFEWQLSCANATPLTLTNMIDDNEWASNAFWPFQTQFDTGFLSLVMGNGGCLIATSNWIGAATGAVGAHVYRCGR